MMRNWGGIVLEQLSSFETEELFNNFNDSHGGRTAAWRAINFMNSFKNIIVQVMAVFYGHKL